MKKRPRWNARRPWTPSEIALLREHAHLTSPQLVRFFTRRTAANILAEKHKLGLMPPKIQVPNIPLDNLTELEYQIIMGSMLGDGGINRASKSYTETHAMPQAKYLMWKRRNLMRLYPSKVGFARAYKGNENAKITFRIGHSYTLWKQLYKEFYAKQGKYWLKTYIPQHILDRLDLIGFLIWFFDDGTAGSKACSPSWSIAVESWNPAALLALVQLLNTRFNLHLYISSSPCKKQSLRIPAQDRHTLLPIWRRIFKKYKMPKCMRYKLRGSLRNNRWTREEISILANNLHSSPKELQLLLPDRTKTATSQKKSQLKAADCALKSK